MSTKAANTKVVEPLVITLEEALAQGIVVLTEEVETMVEEEIAKREKALTKKLTKQITKEMAKKHSIDGGRYSEVEMERYREGSGLTDLKFVRRLIEMNVPKAYVVVLRDEHIKLGTKEIWRIIRDNYKPG